MRGTTGLKTGTTDGAGSCLSATAERDGLGLIAVVMGADTSDHRFAAARSLLDWGFANYKAQPLEGPAGLTPVPVTRGVEPEVPVSFDLPGTIVIPRDKAESISQQVELADSVEAPVTAGQELGSVKVQVDGKNGTDLSSGSLPGCRSDDPFPGIQSIAPGAAGSQLRNAQTGISGKGMAVWYSDNKRETHSGKWMGCRPAAYRSLSLFFQKTKIFQRDQTALMGRSQVLPWIQQEKKS